MNLEKLLKQATEIVNKHEELEKKTGENFNLFSILDRERKEVTTHSRFLAELLSPKGSHGQGSKFLELFVDQLNNEQLKDFDYSTAIVTAELNIGNKKTDLPYWGQIDTFIKDKIGNCIVIENKVYAGDQPEQLLRYHNYLKHPKNGFITKVLYYLTRHGEKPNVKSLSNQIERISEEDFICISYKDLIIPWLEKCIEHSRNIPNVKETISQYLRIVKKITGQINSKLMNDINNHVNKLNLKGAKAIAESYDIALKEVSNALKNEVANKLKSIYPTAKIEIPDKQPKERQKDEYFSSIHINSLLLKNFDGSIFNGPIIIESFNAKGIFFGRSLFIGKFSEDNPKFYADEKIILEQDELFDDLDKYGRSEDKEIIINTIVDVITTYIDVRKA